MVVWGMGVQQYGVWEYGGTAVWGMGYGGTAVWEYGVWDMISRLVTMHGCAQY